MGEVSPPSGQTPRNNQIIIFLFPPYTPTAGRGREGEGGEGGARGAEPPPDRRAFTCWRCSH